MLLWYGIFRVGHCECLLLISGGIFHGDDELTEMSFKYAIERVNFDQLNFELVPKIYRQGRQDSFKTQRIGKSISLWYIKKKTSINDFFFVFSL